MPEGDASIFQNPFRPMLPDDQDLSLARDGSIFDSFKYRKEHRNPILADVELIIIDEISMVRVDTIDCRSYPQDFREICVCHLREATSFRMFFSLTGGAIRPKRDFKPFLRKQFFFSARFLKDKSGSHRVNKGVQTVGSGIYQCIDKIRNNAATNNELNVKCTL